MRALRTTLLILAVAGCTEPAAPARVESPAAQPEALRLTAVVQMAMGGLETQVELRCRLVRAGARWKVEAIHERVHLRDGERSNVESTQRPAFEASSPLEALGLPPLLLKLSGVTPCPQGLVVKVGGVTVPVGQIRTGSSLRGEAVTRGRAALVGSLELVLEARSRWQDAAPGKLPRRLSIEVISTARGGPGQDSSSRVSLDLRVEPEVRS